MRLVVMGPGHPFRGGIAVTTTDLVRALVERGHQVSFLTPRRQYLQRLYPGGDDRDPEACEELECAERCLDPMWPPAWAAARSRALALDASVWLLPFWTWAWAGWWRFVLSGSIRRPPAVAIVHNLVDHDAQALQWTAADLVLNRCDGLFTHASVMARGLRERYREVPVAQHPLPLPGVTRSQRPSREECRRALGIEGSELLAVSVGFIRRYKGLDVLVKAFAHLNEGSRWRLLVAGEAWGGVGEELDALVDRHRLRARVEVRLGWVAEGMLDTILTAADLVVLPYRAASQSAVAPLALAHGLPVLSTAVGGLPDVVVDGHNGRLVPPDDPAALAGALEGLGEAELQRLRQGARERALQLTWGSYATALEMLIDRAVS